MSFFKRGILSIIRRLTKSLILLFIIFILGGVMAGAIAIEQAIRNAEKSVFMKTGAVATLEIDYTKTQTLTPDEYQKKVKSISIDQINKIGNSEYVSYYDFTSTTSLNGSLKRYEDDVIFRPMYEGKDAVKEPDIDISEPAYEPQQYFNIVGVQEKEMIDIQVKRISLLEGRKFNDDEIKNLKYVAMISKNLAEKNNLRLGSKISLKNIVYKMYDKGDDGVIYKDSILPIEQYIQATQDVELEVVGIFDVIRPAVNDPSTSYIYNELENRIYTTNKVVDNVINFRINEYRKTNPEYAEQFASTNYITPLFVLKDPNDLTKFKASIKDDIPEFYKITDNSSSYQKIAAPMKNMQWIASVVLYVAMGATLLILGLLTTLFLKDRRHEMGIYLALGERKEKVIGQIVFEVVAVAFVAITLSLFAGGLIANTVSKEMLTNQLIEDANNNPDDKYYGGGSSSLDWMGYGINITREDLINAYSVSIGGNTSLLFYLVGLGTVFVSTVAPIMYVIRLKPKKILL